MNRNDFMWLTKNLNEKQMVFFYHVLDRIKNDDFPFYCFLTGGTGVDKSVLITALYQAITRYYPKTLSDCPDDINEVLCAPTGKAAHIIGGHTVHSLFCIPANQNLKFKPLDIQQLDTFRVKFRSLKVIFIDEISMVGNKMFNFINVRLQKIIATEQPFGGVSIIAIEDLFQLKPIFDNWIFKLLQDWYGPLATNLWQYYFKMFKLTDIMRQKKDGNCASFVKYVKIMNANRL